MSQLELGPEGWRLRSIEPSDDAAIAAIIRAVMTEFGATGARFAITDPEVDAMAAAFARPGRAYFVLVDPAGLVQGGAGVAPLKDGDPGTCELQKMYLLPAGRGRGRGRRLAERCIEAARALGYRRCYLETLTGMDAAQRLYRKLGFEPLTAPLGCTGHSGCDQWFARDLGALS